MPGEGPEEGPGDGRAGERCSGHRAVSRPPEVWVEAWAPSREQCVAEAVLGVVACFADTSRARPSRTVPFEASGTCDEDLLVRVLEEVLELAGQGLGVPMDAEVEDADGGLDVRLTLAASGTVTFTGEPPEAVCLHDLRFGRGPDSAGGWTCRLTLARSPCAPALSPRSTEPRGFEPRGTRRQGDRARLRPPAPRGRRTR
jgi:SHS2 domain-containing protein